MRTSFNSNNINSVLQGQINSVIRNENEGSKVLNQRKFKVKQNIEEP
jgi:hypothetical protein